MPKQGQDICDAVGWTYEGLHEQTSKSREAGKRDLRSGAPHKSLDEASKVSKSRHSRGSDMHDPRLSNASKTLEPGSSKTRRPHEAEVRDLPSSISSKDRDEASLKKSIDSGTSEGSFDSLARRADEQCPTPPTSTTAVAESRATGNVNTDTKGGAVWELLAASRTLEIDQRRTELKQRITKAETRVREIQDELKKIDAEVSGLRGRSDVNREEAEQHGARAREVQELLNQKVAERDSKEAEYIAMAQQIGISEPEAVLAKVRENPSAPPAQGMPKVLQVYAGLYEECISLEQQESKTRRMADGSGAVTSEIEKSIRRAENKKKDLQKKVQESEAEIERSKLGQEGLSNDHADLMDSVQGVKDAFDWVDKNTLGSMKQTLDNIPWVMLMHNMQQEQYQTRAMLLASNTQNPSFLPEARKRGCTAATLMSAGCTFHDLTEAGYSANELRATGITASRLLHEGVDAKRFKELGYTVSEGLAAGYSSRTLASAYGAKELKEGGITASVLKDLSMNVRDLHDCGYGLKEMHEAGFALEDILNVLGIDVDLPIDSTIVSRRTFLFHDMENTLAGGRERQSDLLCFEEAPPEHRYWFKVGVRPRENMKDMPDHAGIAFIPQAGPDSSVNGSATSEMLSWPLKHDIRMRVFSSDGSSPNFNEQRLDMANLAPVARLIFTEELAPPPPNNELGWSFPMLKKDEYESGKHLFQGTLLVQCELLQSESSSSSSG